MLTKISYFKYDFGSLQWIEHKWFQQKQNIQEDYTSYFSKKSNLVVATFNVLFDIFPEEEATIQSSVRYAYQMKKLLPSTKADVIALQEVTENYLAKLLEQQWVQTEYYVTHFANKTAILKSNNSNSAKRFMVVILSKIPILESYHYFFDKKTCHNVGRPVLVCVLPCPGKSSHRFTICSMHLKAGLEFDETRCKQYKELFNLLDVVESKNSEKKQPKELNGKTHSFILLGDTNMQKISEDENIPEKVIDVWNKLKPDDKGYTYDYKTNPMISAINSKDENQMRLDRIFVYNSGLVGRWVPKQTILFARQTISNVHTSLMASDHYGIAAQLFYELPE